MTVKKRILQPVNLIVFLIFALAAGIVVCLPLFEGANVFLQIGWTCYLLLGMVFFYFVGEKIARTKFAEKYLVDAKAGRLLTGCLLFLVCIGIGGAFRIWEMAEGAVNKNTILNLGYYLIAGLLVYFTVRQISGFRGSAAVVILMALCPFFDFGAEFSVKECVYTLLTLTAVFSISLANYFVEKKAVSLQDTLLTILGSVSLAGATFLHISAMILVFPCIFLLIRKSGFAIGGKKEQRGLRSLLFEVFYICSLVVIFLIYSVEKNQHTGIVEIPLDYDLFHVFGNIGREPVHVLEALLDKFAGLFVIHNQREYYNGLLLGMLILGITGAVLLFREKAERRFFPIYLFNWYFFFGIVLKEFACSGLVLYVLLACTAADAAADLSKLIFAGRKKTDEPETVEEEEEQKEAEPEPVLEKEQEEAEPEPEPVLETKEKAEPESEPEFAAERKEEAEPESEPEPAAERKEKEEPESGQEPVTEMEEETVEKPKEALPASLEKQLQELIKREKMILEIVKKQSTQISKLEEELREQRIRTKKMERHYRKELAVIRNKRR